MTISTGHAQMAKRASLGLQPSATTLAQKAPQKSDDTKKVRRGFGRSHKSIPMGMRTEQSIASRQAPPKFGKAPGEYPEIYGSMTNSGGTSDAGLYQIPTSGTEFDKLFDMTLLANYGGAFKDGVYYLNYYYEYWGIIEFFYTGAYDVETGQKLWQLDMEKDPSVFCPGGMAYNPVDGEIYGITFAADLETLSLSKLDYSSGTSVGKTELKIFDPEVWFTAFAIDAQGQFYGIQVDETTGEGFLCKISQTGEITKIGSTGQYPEYDLTSAAIDPRTGRMFWVINPEGNASFLTEVNLTTGSATVINTYTAGKEVSGIYMPLPAAKEKAPDICENVTVNFTDASLTGQVNFTTPTANYDGTPLDETLTVHILVNGEEKYTASGLSGGTTSSGTVTVPAAGMYTFTVYVSNSAGDGPKTNITDIWVGADTPAATTATAKYADGKMQISWLPVTESVNGGYLDLSKLTYTVKDAEGKVLASNLTDTSYSFTLALPDELTTLYYTVTVVCDGLESQPARTNSVSLGSITPPYVPDFAKDGLSAWTVIDANEDNKIWTVYPNDGSVRISYNSSKKMDDWLITPPLKLEAGKSYPVSFLAGNSSSYYTEKLEVKWGDSNTAEALTNELLAPTALTIPWQNGGTTFEKMLVVPADGIYYIGFHGISDAWQLELYLNNISIEQGVSDSAPGEVTNLVAIPDAYGALKTTVTFNAPDKTLAGGTLSSLTKVELYNGNTLVKTFDAPTPGAQLSYTDNSAQQGNNTYTVIGYNTYGNGLKTTTTCFVGFDLPNAPEGVTISRTNVEGQVLLTWDAVTKDVNGLTYGNGDVTYTVSVYDNGWKVIADNITACTYSYQAVAAGQQDFVQLSVTANTPAGDSKASLSRMIPVGKPYAGLDETFADGKDHYIWGIDGNASAYYGTDATFVNLTSANGDNGYFYFNSPFTGNYGSLYSGLIDLTGIDNPALTFYTYNIMESNADINTISVSVKESDSNDWITIVPPTSVDELCGGVAREWSKVTVPLAAYSNKTLQIMLTGAIEIYAQIYLDDIKVGSILGNDLYASSITAPGSVTAGEDYTVNVNVTNEGANTATSYTVELYANGKLSDTKECSNLASGKIATVSFEQTMSPVVKAGDEIEYYAVVVFSQDENDKNNLTDTITVAPIVSTLPVATDLKGEYANGGVQLTWTEPSTEGGIPAAITDDFEDANGVTDKYGDWTFVDVDGKEVDAYFPGLVIPGITGGTTKGSFWIWDNDVIGGGESLAAHSGSKFLFALARYDYGQSDDWAISPELCGDAQTISFFAKSYSPYFPEKITIYYSTTGKDIETDFIELEDGTIKSVPNAWTEYSFNLPAGAKYFAIRSWANGAAMLMIDDVTYTPEGSFAPLEIDGYNVYRDGVKINDDLVETCEYHDTTVVGGETYKYVVTAVFVGQGESAGSDPCIVAVSGVEDVTAGVSVSVEDRSIVIANAQGLNVTVSAANGVLIYNGTGEAKTAVRVDKGVYIVKVGTVVKKVLVK